MPNKVCKTEGCAKPVFMRGMCRACYYTWWINQPGNRKRTEKNNQKWHKEHPKARYKAIKRWRKKHLDKRNLERKANYDKGAIFNINGGKIYDDSEIQMILDKVLVNENGRVIKKNVTDREIAKYIGRTVRAIQTQRSKFKKIMAQEQS